MGSKRAMNLALFSTLLLLLVGLASSDINQDKAECTDKLLALSNCLPYVSGQAQIPTMDCCDGLKEVIDKNKRCLCILIKDHDDPNLGIKLNVTLALKLPTTCHKPTNITECIDLLHLAPKSPEAKVFEGFEKEIEGNSTTPVTSASSTGKGTSPSSQVKNGGGWGKRLLVAERVHPHLSVCMMEFQLTQPFKGPVIRPHFLETKGEFTDRRRGRRGEQQSHHRWRGLTTVQPPSTTKFRSPPTMTERGFRLPFTTVLLDLLAATEFDGDLRTPASC
ncbi:Bifunctional inhibitor/plant lipid transfer protein/seed storage helical domain [Sesbania bispinosa]|nr:Bifunctional inhibitor/plant lipid transfer protein/seed storage helical domain [Sesbania bispinosa]